MTLITMGVYQRQTADQNRDRVNTKQQQTHWLGQQNLAGGHNTLHGKLGKQKLTAHVFLTPLDQTTNSFDLF